MTPNFPDTPGCPPDELDRLLSDYFRRQLPRTWPAAPSPFAEPASVAAARNGAVADGTRGRWVVAASAAVLLGVCWYASSGVAPAPYAPTRGAGYRAATAEGADALREMEKQRATEAKGVAPLR